MILSAPGMVSSSVYAADNTKDNLCNGANLSLSSNEGCAKKCEDSKGREISCTKRVDDVIGMVINVLSVIVGLVAVIMIIYSGFRYITSGGDSGKIDTAKNTILYAIVGLVIVASAQFIAKFVLAKVSNGGKSRPSSSKSQQDDTKENCPSGRYTASNPPKCIPQNNNGTPI